MKIVGNIQVLAGTDASLRLDESIARTMRLQPNTTLDAMVLLPSSNNGPGIRKMTLVVTPLPEAAWGHLIRISATLKPSTGSLEKIVTALQKLNLLCRHIETINGVNLFGTSAYGPDRRIWDLISDQEDDLVIPSTFFVLELLSNPPNDKEAAKLHASIRQMIDNNQSKASNRIRQVAPRMTALLKKYSSVPVEVDWVSPMSTLNRLAHKLNIYKEKPNARRFSQQLLVSSAANCLQIDLSNLRNVLWNLNSRVPYKITSNNDNSLFVQGFADSDEQIMCWDFYEFHDGLVVQFDVTTPTAGLEQRWWEWLYSSISTAGGNILASSSSARIDGRWGTVRTTAIFPFNENSDDIEKIAYCFRVLQGDRGYTNEFGLLKAQLTEDYPLFKDSIELQRDPEPSFSSILQNVEVWDPGDGIPVRGYAQRFAPNPFNFTLPLDLKRYSRLYGKQFTQSANDMSFRNRHRLARRIVERLSGDIGENIAIVGAHRSGKTTVLNLVQDTLWDMLKRGGSIIPIRLNAAVDSPGMLLESLIAELNKMISSLDKTKPKSKASNIKETLTQLRGAVKEQAVRHAPTIASLMAASMEGNPSEMGALAEWAPKAIGSVSMGPIVAELAKSLRRENDTSTKSAPESTLEPFKDSIANLRKSLLELDAETAGMRILVIIDEFSETSRWGQPQAFPVLRHVIESREYSRIKWLFSASRPVSESTEYSPITNVLFEYNVGQLSLEESERMIDAFGASDWHREFLDGKPPKSLLRPVIMHQARLFLLGITSRLPYLLQVSCYHIYDRAVRTYVPLIGRALCVRIILEKVLPEISDYFAHQWKDIPCEARRRIQQSLRNSNQKDFLMNFEQWDDNISDMPSGFRKALERSGLRGEDSHSVAPLVACWLLTASAE